MVVESYAIIAVMLLMILLLARAGKQQAVLFTVPLMSVPVFHLIGIALQLQVHKLLFAAIGLLAGLALSFLFSHWFKTRRGKAGYFFICLSFLAALFFAYYLNLG